MPNPDSDAGRALSVLATFTSELHKMDIGKVLGHKGRHSGAVLGSTKSAIACQSRQYRTSPATLLSSLVFMLNVRQEKAQLMKR